MRVASPALTFLLASAVDAFSPISIGRPSDATKLSAYGIGSWNKSSSGGGGGVAVATPTRNPWDDSNAGQHVEKSYGIDSWTSAPPKMKKSYGLGSWNKAASTTGGADAVAADMLNSSRKASTAAAAQLPSTDNFKSSPRWRKKTKQLATLGPASSTFEMIEKLFLAGADVFRLNFSHGEHAQKKELLDIIRAVEDKYDHPIAILGDLQGPKIRTGTFANPDGEMLQEGQIFRFDSDETPGNNQRVFLPHPEIIEASEIGHELLIDDGKVKVVVVGTGPGYLDCEVVVGGMIKDRKGPLLITYFEQTRLESAVVARGDLGVECQPEDVPILQKVIIDECRSQGKPVVVATQMMESMIDSPTPTRAEASDAATAIYDGADAIMLSAESAAGSYPVESVMMQQRIINRVEGDPHYSQYLQNNRPRITDGSSTAAIILAARSVAKNVNAKCIASFTVGGSTARKASMKRPEQPIMAISPLKETCRQLAMSWGVYAEYCPKENLNTDNFRDMLQTACDIGLKKGLVSDDKDLLVVTAGFPFGTPGAANIIRVIPAAGPTYWDSTL
ncbi:hypothetical protein ACHAWC_004396 [Mediolabrus comicus]